MATRGTNTRDSGIVELPDAVPFSLPRATRLSWELGTRVVDDEEAVLHSEWEHAASSRSLSIHRVTRNTAVVNLRTPVGRERFYGATLSAVESAFADLDEAPCWHRSDDETPDEPL